MRYMTTTKQAWYISAIAKAILPAHVVQTYTLCIAFLASSERDIQSLTHSGRVESLQSFKRIAGGGPFFAGPGRRIESKPVRRGNGSNKQERNRVGLERPAPQQPDPCQIICPVLSLVMM